jgi:ribosomal protein S18 acetylase RimI-like enzyme
MEIRLYRAEDAQACARLSAACARSETDFVLNPLWETEAELEAEFQRHGIRPEDHLLVVDAGAGEVVGLSGFLRPYGAEAAGMFCPIVERGERGRGVGGELLRAALAHGRERLGLRLATAGIGTRNRGGYALLCAHGFRPVRQHFLMRCEAAPSVPPPPVPGLELAMAEPGDLAAIHAIYAACGFDLRTPDEMQARFADGRHVHAVARHDGKVVAFTEIETHWPTRPWVAFVGVAPELRDRGVGSTLVAWALGHLFETGAESALLMLSPANRTAVRAYSKVGFRLHRTFDVLEKGLVEA